ncbi:MAG: GDSL-type esterase/lipase family protein [Edaphocola sp.]
MYRYLALGDSYTIGEQVGKDENFPNQTVRCLAQRGVEIHAPQIIATTGWTTDELQAGIEEAKPGADFDLVTLLIGVNNQYRGRTQENYASEFEHLLYQAIAFAKNEPQRVVVLSIPDWGCTPFAAGKDSEKIAAEIDAFNSINKALCLAANGHYLDITDSTRENGSKPEYLTEDKLHYAAKEYGIWAKRLSALVLAQAIVTP